MNKFLLATVAFLFAITASSQGLETFTNLPAAQSNYVVRNWTGDNGLAWTATDSRTDQTINGRALGLRFGAINSSGMPNGIGNLTFKYQYIFTGVQGELVIRVNGNVVGNVSVPSTATSVNTATVNNINIPGSFTLEIAETVSGPRIAIDDIEWTGFTGAACIVPTGQPTSLSLNSITNTSISGSFNASSPAANEYLVLISTSNTLSTTPQNGTTYSEGDVVGNSTVVSRSSSTAFTASSLSAGTTYYFYIFAVNSACNGGPLYNSTAPLTGNATTTVPPVCVAPTTAPGALTLSAAGTSVSGSFTAATGADGYLAIISNSPTLTFTPANGTNYSINQTVGNGTVIKYGTGTSFSATGLTVSTTYYFYVFSVSNFNCTGGPLYNSTSSNGSATTTANATGEPTGYYSTTTGLSCEILKDTLSRIITRGYLQQSYSSLFDHFQTTDKRLNDAGTTVIVWDMYSDNPTGPEPYEYTYGPTFQDNGTGGSAEGQKYNREHSWPNSWFGGSTSNPAYSDLFHLYPTDKFVNNLRSSFPFGETSSPTNTTLNGSKLGPSTFAGITGTVFEPINAYKGDFARTYFYMATRYHSQIAGWENFSQYGDSVMDGTAFPSFEINYLRLLLKWHNQDPVSQKEIDRNQSVFAIQKNRNPFIDHPEYVQMIWNSSCSGLAVLPVEILYFSGKLLGNAVRLEWKVENEIRFNRYEIERSVNGNFYTKIGQVKAANLRNYSFEDDAETLKGKRVYYRLKSIDQDGNYKYSQVFTIHLPLNAKFTVYPNPAKSFIQLQLNKHITGLATVQVTDVSGKVLKQQNFNVTGNILNVSTENFSSGTYLVKLIFNGEQYMQKVIVAK